MLPPGNHSNSTEKAKMPAGMVVAWTRPLGVARDSLSVSTLMQPHTGWGLAIKHFSGG